MYIEKTIITILVIIALGGLAWSAYDFFKVAGQDRLIDNSLENFDRAVLSELPDKCQAPDGYTDSEWQEHMSHHPERYRECFSALEPADFKNISVSDLKAMLESKSEFTLVDTHIPEQEHIPGTDVFIPYSEIDRRLEELPEDKSAPVVLYCRSGNMSETAAKSLIKAGYTNVYNVLGGAQAWQDAGYGIGKTKL